MNRAGRSSSPRRASTTGSCCTAARPRCSASRRSAKPRELAEAVAQVPGLDGSGVLMTIADGRLTVRLTRGVLAAGARARRAGPGRLGGRAGDTVPSPTAALRRRSRSRSRPSPTTIDVGFWRAVLGYDPMADDNAVDPLGHGSTVWMQELDPGKPLRHAMHVDVSVAREHAEARVAAALAAGGRIVDDSDAPGAWILADRAGNKVCIAAWPDGATHHR